MDMELEKTATLTLVPTSPFHFDGTVFNPSHFPSNDHHWEPGHYWQTLRWKGETYGIRLDDAGSVAKPRIDAVIFASKKPPEAHIEEITEETRWRFDLDSEGVPEFVRRFRRDRYIGPAIRSRPGFRPKSAYSLYEYFVITVVLQNTVVSRSASMLHALFERFGQLVSFDGRTLWAFWDPESLDRASEEELRALRLGYRARTLKRQAEQLVHGEIDERELRKVRDEKTIGEILDRIYGVGPQSSWYTLFELFHFYDAQEHISPWEGTIVGKVLFGRKVSAKRVRVFLTKRYEHFRQLAFYYLITDLFWRHREQPISWLTELVRR